jgi:radical SAM superfamily enzyme YgiQ (UPF0313 family)
VQTKRGCALDCSFCVYGRIEGRRYRLHDPVAIADEIQGAVEDGIWLFEFTDSLFNVPLEHAVAVCASIAGRRLGVSLNTSGVHPAFFTRELAEAMERAGFEELSFAPDSASPTVLSRLGKGFATQDPLVRAAELARSTPMKIVWWFSFGLPGENRETVDETLRFVRDHVRPNDLALCTVGLRILPGTRLEAIAREEGQLEPDHDLLRAVYYQPSGIALEEIQARLTAAAEEMPNVVLNSETRSFPVLIVLGSFIKRWTRHRQPLWAGIPHLNRVRRRVRGLFGDGSGRMRSG